MRRKKCIEGVAKINGSQPIYKSSDKTCCNDYRGISTLPTTYKILSNIFLSRLTPYIDEIMGDHQCEFPYNRLTVDHIF
jgi:hypothetical protein